MEVGDWATLLARERWGIVYSCVPQCFSYFFKYKKLNPFYDPKLAKVHRLFKGPKGGLDRVQFPPRSCWLSLRVASPFQLLFKAMLFTPVWAEPGNCTQCWLGGSWWPMCRAGPQCSGGDRTTGSPGWLSSRYMGSSSLEELYLLLRPPSLLVLENQLE